MAAPWAVIEGMMRIGKEQPGLVAAVLALVTERGPIAAREAVGDGPRRNYPERRRMWNWQDVKIALEWLFFMGKVTTAARRGFERIYDLTERVLPPEVLSAPTPDPEGAQRELLRIAARAQGIASEKQLRDYFRIRPELGRPRIAELVEAGDLVPVRVERVSQPMYLWPDATVPQRVQARAFLSPFDSLIWDRERIQRLFSFHYRISIFTPAAERTHGYYVMPFLLGDQLVARVDLKADRHGSALVVQVAHAESDASEREVAAEMAEELRLLADWLELDRIEVKRQGNLGLALARAVNARR